MVELDFDSPFTKEIAGEFYNIKTEQGPDTAISSELKQWESLSEIVKESEAEEDKKGQRSYVYAGVAIIFMIGIIFIGVQEILKKGAVWGGLLDIIGGIIFGPYVIKKSLPYRKKRK